MEAPLTFLCLASYYKGAPFMEEAKAQGCRVILLTADKLRHEPWPHHAIDETFYMESLSKEPDITRAVSYLAQSRDINFIVPLDDYDVETAARLREHLRLPGMGDTTARFFRDKLAMRVQSKDEGIPVPDFVHVLNYGQIDHFLKTVSGPWVLKPRSEAGSVGIKKCNDPDEVWHWVHQLGDLQSYYLLERYVAGDVFHVDSIVFDKKLLFSQAHRYGTPPFNVWNHGGVFSTRTLHPEDPGLKQLLELNEKVVRGMRLARGVTHAEYIQGHDGKFYFLELAARVGGASIDVLVDKASGVNLWREWVKLELAHHRKKEYRPPQRRHDHAGLLLCLARQEHPDMGYYAAPEVVWRVSKPHHAGLIVVSHHYDRVTELMDYYKWKFGEDFLEVLPPTETAV